jgi:mannosyl-oligosaccharide alpha-1,3-glucosidase
LLLSHNVAMAVDRSKFRTCEQTSFCRRHRLDTNGNLFQYKLLADTIHFHPQRANEGTDGQVNEADVHSAERGANDSGEDKSSSGGVWESIQRRLLGHTGGSDVEKSSSGRDIYVRGPSPTLTGRLQNVAAVGISNIGGSQLEWSVTALQSGLVRMRVTEVYDGVGSIPHDMPARVTYDELVLEVAQLQHAGHAIWLRPDANVAGGKELMDEVLQQRGVTKENFSNYAALQYGDSADKSDPSRMLLLVQMEPFVVALYRENSIVSGPIVELSADQMMHFEVRRVKSREQQESATEPAKSDIDEEPVEGGKEIVGYWEDGLAIYADGTREEKKVFVEETHRRLSEMELDQEGLWEENFGSHTDSKPYGPMSVGMDISFPSSTHLYGIPEHAASAVLQTTTGEGSHFKEPYRLYNLDVFEFELDEAMALYGEVPLVVSQSVSTGSVGVFWFNPTETFVDVAKLLDRTQTHWISESGVLDIFLMPGPDPTHLYKQYATLTGTTPLPPMFSLGYHQCRWNYKDEKDVASVHSKFEELDYPYDVLWLDIEHTDGKRYFTWDKSLFPNPKVMQQNLAAQGRRMVTIVDPHIKRDEKYYIHKEATAKGLYIKDKDGVNDYDGWCWPGASSYLDFTAEHVRSWWADQFAYNKYEGSTPSLFTWNDMNEPSVFNGPEVSMQKDLRNLNGEEHREWHNLYGMLFHRATAEGQIRRNKPTQDVRPFVLSRAFFAGSQKYGAIWTGDNAAEWEHLAVAAPMLLSLNTAALSFVGADVGGFFGDPNAELFTRWMQAGAYQPFFRGHAHHNSKRREPWMFEKDTFVRLRRAAMTRYALLPYWYTVFYEAETTGMPVMRMMWMQYPKTESVFSLDNQYLIGSDLLVKPVTAEGVKESEIVFPMDHLWYDVLTMVKTSSTIKANEAISKVVPSDIDSIPVFQRGGSIIPRKLRLRRSTLTMKTDPYTLYVALDGNNNAVGKLHMDDEETFGYKKRLEYADATFMADFNVNGKLTNSVVVGSGWDNDDKLGDAHMIERIIVMGLQNPPSKLIVEETGNSLDFSYEAASNILVVRKPELSATSEWTVKLL